MLSSQTDLAALDAGDDDDQKATDSFLSFLFFSVFLNLTFIFFSFLFHFLFVHFWISFFAFFFTLLFFTFRRPQLTLNPPKGVILLRYL